MTLATLPQSIQSKRDPTKEYVAGSPLGWYVARQQALPDYIDDLTLEFGDDLYDRMGNDPMVRACTTILRSGILEESATLLPAIDDADADGYAQSAELVPWCQAILDDLTIALDDVLFDMLGCLSYGNRVAEQVYAYDRTYSGKTELILQALKPKPRTATAFVVDPYLNVLGLLGQVDGRSVVLPRERFAVLTFRPKDSDPRGSTLLRAAYNAWDLKMRAWPEYLKYLVQFASPSLFGTTAEGADTEPAYDSNGQPTGEYISSEMALLTKLLQFQNGSAIAARFGTQIKEILSQGEGKAFLEAFRLFDRQIAMGIVGQTRALLEAEFGSKADSSTANDLLSTLVRQMKRSVCRMLRTDVLRPLVRYNFGPDAERLTPYATLGETEPQDWAARLNAAAGAGYLLDPSQWPGIDELLNLPPRAPTDQSNNAETNQNDQQQGDQQGDQQPPDTSQEGA